MTNPGSDLTDGLKALVVLLAVLALVLCCTGTGFGFVMGWWLT